MRASILLLGVGCHADKDGGGEGSWGYAEPGTWFAADFHVHTSTGSNDTDGVSFAADHAAVARERGLSLVALTDHSNSAGSMDCPTGDVEDCPNQGPEFVGIEEAAAASGGGLTLVVGSELSPVASLDFSTEPTGHVGCLPRTAGGLDGIEEPFIDRPVGEVAGGSGVEWCHGVGGFASVNHPFALAAWIEYDWTSLEYDGLEVFNGLFDAGDVASVDAWLCDLASGRGVVPLGGSDCHRASTPAPPPDILDQALGWPTTWLRAADGGADTLLAALAAGRVVIAEPGTRLEVLARAGGAAVGPGESLAAEEATIRLQAEVSSPGLVLELLDVPAGSCVDPRRDAGEAPEVAYEVLLSVPLEPGAAASEEIAVDAGGGRILVARIWPTAADLGSASGVALAAPIRISR